MKKANVIISIATVAVALSTLVGFGLTYSWIQREFKPDFEGSNLMVKTSGTLAIKLDNDSVTSKVDLNSVLNLHDFTLKQVSNSTGYSTDFFGIEYDAATGSPKLKYLTNATGDYTELGKENGYIESRFLITCSSNQEDYDSKFVFLDNSPNSCYIEFPDDGGLIEGKDVREAIRISLSAPDIGYHYLFRKTVYNRDASGNIIQNQDGSVNKKAHRGAKANLDSNGLTRYVDGMPIYDPAQPTQLNTDAYVDNFNIHEFSDFDGGVVNGDESNFDDDKVLFSMNNGYVWVVLRIWLEGYDENTVDVLSGAKVNVKLTFRMNSDPAGQTSSQNSSN